MEIKMNAFSDDLNLIHVLDRNHPKAYEYALILNDAATDLRDSLWLPCTYSKAFIENIDPTELDIIENTEQWFADGFKGYTITLDSDDGVRSTQNYVNVFGWMDRFILFGDGTLFNIARSAFLNLCNYKNPQEALYEIVATFQDCAYYMLEHKIPVTKNYHCVERLCKHDNLTIAECVEVCSTLVDVHGIKPHPGSIDFFFVDSEALSTVQDVISTVKAS